jgi:hypothetical protein
VEEGLAVVEEAVAVLVGDGVGVLAEAAGGGEIDEEGLDRVGDLRRVPAALVLEHEVADGFGAEDGVGRHRELVKALPPRVVGERDGRGGPGFAGLLAGGGEVGDRFGDGEALLVQQRLVVVHADQVGEERHAVEDAVDRRALASGLGDALVPAVLGGEVIERLKQAGFGEDAGVARPRVVEDDVRSGPRGEGGARGVAHLLQTEGFAADRDVGVLLSEAGVDLLDRFRFGGIGELVPDEDLDRGLRLGPERGSVRACRRGRV